MKNFKVKLILMVDPSVNDKKCVRTYSVSAKNESDALIEAGKMQTNDSPEVRHLSVFNYDIKEVFKTKY